MIDNEIDIVVTWVDGADPEWRAERNKYVQNASDTQDLFFRDWCLMRYWFRGIEKNIDWIRKVHFVTWGHVPPWLNLEHPKLEIVNHRDFIPSKYLPVFSANPIELNFHRIPGIAEQFVIANDDIFFLDRVDKEYFFRDGKPCDYLMLRPVTEFKPTSFSHLLLENITCINRNFQMQECIGTNPEKWFSEAYPASVVENNQRLSKLKYFPGLDWDHQLMPVCKSVFEEVWRKESRFLDNTCRNRFRSLLDCTDLLIREWQLASGNFVPFMRPNAKCVSVDRPPEEIADVILNKENKIMCFIESRESIDFEKRSKYFQELMEIRLPRMSEFEKY